MTGIGSKAVIGDYPVPRCEKTIGDDNRVSGCLFGAIFLLEEVFCVLSQCFIKGLGMRIAMFVALAATAAGCATSPVDYGASLSKQDRKWASPECQQARMEASDYDAREKKQPGWGTGVFLGPYGLGLAAAIKEHQQKQRKLFARAVHLRCSSLPLPKALQSDLSPRAATANQTKYP